MRKSQSDRLGFFFVVFHLRGCDQKAEESVP